MRTTVGARSRRRHRGGARDGASSVVSAAIETTASGRDASLHPHGATRLAGSGGRGERSARPCGACPETPLASRSVGAVREAVGDVLLQGHGATPGGRRAPPPGGGGAFGAVAIGGAGAASEPAKPATCSTRRASV